jgi:DMSO/TMAO reductase YedYZ molybdopterin-dependent catalytic subunit
MERSRLVTRRRALAGGMSAVGALLLPGCSRVAPPTYGNILRMGDVLTYEAQRLLLPRASLAREYEWKDVSSFPAIGTTDPSKLPAGEAYARWVKGGFADWRLRVEGSVARPGWYSLEELKSFPARTQVTKHNCEEGWTAIAAWTGVPLRFVLEHAGMLPGARFVQFIAVDGYADGIDLLDALHPQTLLAYGMNGRALAVRHGAPVRVRVERQLGYKSIKYVQRIVVTEVFDDGGPTGNIQNGWSWYAGI